MRDVLYLIGAPGSGKSTLMAGLVAGHPAVLHAEPFAHLCYAGAVQLGASRDAYPGTDTLALNVQARVLAWLARTDLPLVLGEGDRLANAPFFRAVVTLGYRLTVCWLDAPWPVLWARVCARPRPQPEAWVRGRDTKVRRLGAGWVLPRWHLDATAPPASLVARLQAHPAIQTWKARPA
jgi:predicted nucleotide kinase in modified base biosynthesis